MMAPGITFTTGLVAASVLCTLVTSQMNIQPVTVEVDSRVGSNCHHILTMNDINEIKAVNIETDDCVKCPAGGSCPSEKYCEVKAVINNDFLKSQYELCVEIPDLCSSSAIVQTTLDKITKLDSQDKSSCEQNSKQPYCGDVDSLQLKYRNSNFCNVNGNATVFLRRKENTTVSTRDLSQEHCGIKNIRNQTGTIMSFAAPTSSDLVDQFCVLELSNSKTGQAHMDSALCLNFTSAYFPSGGAILKVEPPGTSSREYNSKTTPVTNVEYCTNMSSSQSRVKLMINEGATSYDHSFILNYEFKVWKSARKPTIPPRTNDQSSGSGGAGPGNLDDIVTKVVIISVLVIMFIAFVVYYMGCHGKKVGTFGKKKRKSQSRDSNQEEPEAGRSESLQMLSQPCKKNDHLVA